MRSYCRSIYYAEGFIAKPCPVSQHCCRIVARIGNFSPWTACNVWPPGGAAPTESLPWGAPSARGDLRGAGVTACVCSDLTIGSASARKSFPPPNFCVSHCNCMRIKKAWIWTCTLLGTKHFQHDAQSYRELVVPAPLRACVRCTWRLKALADVQRVFWAVGAGASFATRWQHGRRENFIFPQRKTRDWNFSRCVTKLLWCLNTHEYKMESALQQNTFMNRFFPLGWCNFCRVSAQLCMLVHQLGFAWDAMVGVSGVRGGCSGAAEDRQEHVARGLAWKQMIKVMLGVSGWQVLLVWEEQICAEVLCVWKFYGLKNASCCFLECMNPISVVKALGHWAFL